MDPGGMFPSSDLAEVRGPAPPAGSAVLMGPVGPAMSLETLLPGVDVPELCKNVLIIGLLLGWLFRFWLCGIRCSPCRRWRS